MAGPLELSPGKNIAQPKVKLPKRSSKDGERRPGLLHGRKFVAEGEFRSGRILTQGIFPSDAVQLLTNSS